MGEHGGQHKPPCQGGNYFKVTKEEERCLKENNEIDTNQVSSSVQSRRAIKKISRREGICKKDSEDEGEAEEEADYEDEKEDEVMTDQLL